MTSTTTHRAQPCNGCPPAPRRSHRMCSADQCQQGRAPCPCPAACEVPERAAHDHFRGATEMVDRADTERDEADDRREVVITLLVLLCAIAVVIFAVKTLVRA